MKFKSGGITVSLSKDFVKSFSRKDQFTKKCNELGLGLNDEIISDIFYQVNPKKKEEVPKSTQNENIE